jgi:phage terminase large subunit GpA-like protein
MDAVHEPGIREIVIQKAAQIGASQVLLNIAAYFIDHDPAPMMWVQTTLNEANHFAKIRFAAFLEDNPRIAAKMKRGTNNTQKVFPGGMIVFRGSKSAPGLRQFPIRVVIMDDMDGFVDTTPEGDPVELAAARTRAFTRRLTIKCSTPVVEHRSRVVKAYEASDQRKYLVPCHACGDEQEMVWGQVKWDLGEEGRGDPRTARYECIACGERWTDVHRWRGIRQGRWQATRPFLGMAGFKIGGLISPFITLEEIVRKYLEAEGDDDALEVFMNTTLGEATRHQHEKPDIDVLYERREPYAIEMVPKGGLVLTAGVDVQKNRLELEVVAWGRGLESWSVAHMVLWGDPTGEEPWKQLEEVLFERDWAHEETGVVCKIARVAVDAGFSTNSVYGWWRGLSKEQRRMTMLTVGRDRTEYAVKPATLKTSTSAARR